MTDDYEFIPECEHKETDQLGPICIWCGRVECPRPEFAVIVGAILFFGAHLAYWAYLGFSFVK